MAGRFLRKKWSEAKFIGRYLCQISFSIMIQVIGWLLRKILYNKPYPSSRKHNLNHTTQKMKFSTKDFFSKLFLHLLKKSLVENFIFLKKCHLLTLHTHKIVTDSLHFTKLICKCSERKNSWMSRFQKALLWIIY